MTDLRLDAMLAEYTSSDDRKRAELTFKLILAISKETAETNDRVVSVEKDVGRYSKRLRAVEHIIIPNRIRAPDDSGHYELVELRDNRKFWLRLAITTMVGVLSALVITGIVALGRYIATH